MSLRGIVPRCVATSARPFCTGVCVEQCSGVRHGALAASTSAPRQAPQRQSSGPATAALHVMGRPEGSVVLMCPTLTLCEGLVQAGRCVPNPNVPGCGTHGRAPCPPEVKRLLGPGPFDWTLSEEGCVYRCALFTSLSPSRCLATHAGALLFYP